MIDEISDHEGVDHGMEIVLEEPAQDDDGGRNGHGAQNGQEEGRRKRVKPVAGEERKDERGGQRQLEDDGGLEHFRVAGRMGAQFAAGDEKGDGKKDEEREMKEEGGKFFADIIAEGGEFRGEGSFRRRLRGRHGTDFPERHALAVEELVHRAVLRLLDRVGRGG